MRVRKHEQRPRTNGAAHALARPGELLPLLQGESAPRSVRLGVHDRFDQASAPDRARRAELRRRRRGLGRLVVGIPRIKVAIRHIPTRSVVAPTPRGLTAEAASPRLTRLIQVVS